MSWSTIIATARADPIGYRNKLDETAKRLNIGKTKEEN